MNRQRFFYFERTQFNHDLHLWAGPLGLHLFWPPRGSGFEWFKEWRDG